MAYDRRNWPDITPWVAELGIRRPTLIPLRQLTLDTNQDYQCMP